jgi:hypothetical protein
MTHTSDPVHAFLEAASVPRDASHASGTLALAESLLAAHPEVAGSSIYTAAVLGDDVGIRRFLAGDPSLAVQQGGPYDWAPLTYLCFSRYLKFDRTRSDGFVRAATALLDAGADPNSGWFGADHQPAPTLESVLYGAAGIAHHGPLTRLLIERGADPNDDETPYHTPESYDNDALKALVESGKVTEDNLVMMLIRKHDWHDLDGVAYLLAHGADPTTSDAGASRLCIMRSRATTGSRSSPSSWTTAPIPCVRRTVAMRWPWPPGGGAATSSRCSGAGE